MFRFFQTWRSRNIPARRSIPQLQLLEVESLELRTLLTTFTVDTLLDQPNNTDDVLDGYVSLREAISAANSNDPFGDAPAGTANQPDVIRFDESLHGSILKLGGSELVISSNISIEGPGVNLFGLSGDNKSRIIRIGTGAQVTIKNLTLTEGKSTTSSGGAIRNSGDLFLKTVWITGNQNLNSGGGGGGVSNVNGTMAILNSTVSGNSTAGSGGGIVSIGATSIRNTTISGNSADVHGGGVLNLQGHTTFLNATVVNNNTDFNDTNNGTGGGIWTSPEAQSNIATTELFNTIVAGNTKSSLEIPSDLAAKNVESTSKANLIGNAESAGGLEDDLNGNIVGQSGAGTIPINQILNPILLNNGGEIPTHALTDGSVAIDAGDEAASLAGGITSDTRGTPFARSALGSNSGTPLQDIGAYERQALLIVNTLEDETTNDTTFSLREAIGVASIQDIDGGVGGLVDVIQFDSALSGGTILLDGTELSLAGKLRITGPGATLLTISGSSLSRIFQTQPDSIVEVSGLKLTAGDGGTEGGAIDNNGDLTLRQMWITGNQAQFGGAIDNYSNSINLQLTIIESTIDQNDAATNGGGIFNGDNLTIINSTFSQNRAGAYGGAIRNETDGAITFVNSTVVHNIASAAGTSTDFGGGVSVESGSVTLSNSLVAGNRSSTSLVLNEIHGSVVATSNNNLIGDSGSSGGLVDGSLGNIVGVHVPDVLDPILRFNGGSTPTHALLPNSPAINRGSNASALDENGDPLTADQRGVVFPRKLGARVDIGAFEGFLDPLTSIAGFVNGNWWLAAPNAQGDYSTAQAAAGPASTFQKVLTGDFNGDGIQDLAAWLFNGEWRIGLGNGIGSFDFSSWTVWNAPDIKEVHVGDFNQDGKDDIIGLFKNGTRGRWWVAQSNGQKFLNRHWGDFGNYNGIAEVLVGNFDGVKGDDLTIITLTGNVFVAKTSNTQFQYLLSHQWGINNGFEFAQVGDFNGDSRDDVVAVFGTGAQRSLFVAKSVGPALGFASLKFADLTATQSFDSLLVGDFDGDGKDDVAARINTTKWWVGLTGTNQFSFSLWTTWSFAANGLFDVHVGSTNGDHRSDIIGRDENGKWLTAEAYSGTFLNRVIETWSPVNWQFVNGGDYQLQPAASIAATEAPTPEPALPTTRWMPPEEQTTNPTEKTSTSDSQDPTTSTPPADPESYELFGQQDLLEMLY